MKLNIGLLKNICKNFLLIILILLVIYCIYILYFSTNKYVENFSSTLDCSNCEIKPSSGNCLKIIDISYQILSDGNLDISFIDTNYTFCPWESNCPETDNLIEQSERIKIAKKDLTEHQVLNNIRCCSGSNFSNNNTLNYYNIDIVKSLNNKCQQINKHRNLLDLDNDPLLSGSLKKSLSKSDAEFFRLRDLCNKQDFSGMLFEISLVNVGNIITNPELTVREILDYQNILEVDQTKISDINTLNNQLKNLNPASIAFNNDKQKIQNELASNFISSISYELFQYKLLNKNRTQILQTNNSPYILNNDQFFDCFGAITDPNVAKFSDANLLDFSRNDYFDVANDASYSTIQDNRQRLYPNRQDLEMELKNLEQIPQGGTAPTSIINQYLTAINSFYEKQMQNMLGPRTHAVNQQLVFDNNTLDVKESTFFTYEKDPNMKYECSPSITGANDFSYCGPEAYYQEFKF